jgi:hypothetical protein
LVAQEADVHSACLAPTEAYDDPCCLIVVKSHPIWLPALFTEFYCDLGGLLGVRCQHLGLYEIAIELNKDRTPLTRFRTHNSRSHYHSLQTSYRGRLSLGQSSGLFS